MLRPLVVLTASAPLSCPVEALVAVPPIVEGVGSMTVVPVAGAGVVGDPIMAAPGPDGAIWAIERRSDGSTAVVLLGRSGNGGAAVPFLEHLVGASAVVPIDVDRALVLEPPLLHLAIDRDADGRADETRVVAGGLDGATDLVLLADGTLAFPGVPVRLRWLGDAVEAEASPALPGSRVCEGADGDAFFADGGLVRRSDLAWLGGAAVNDPAPLGVFAVAAGGGASASITGLAWSRGQLVVASADGAIGTIGRRNERWNWSSDLASIERWAVATPSRAATLRPDLDGAILVAYPASEPGAADGSIHRLAAMGHARSAPPRLDAPLPDLLAQLAHVDPVRRAMVREAIVARTADGRLDRSEVATAVRALLRSHAAEAVRRESVELLSRIDALGEGDLGTAAADIDPTVRRAAMRQARRAGERALLDSGLLDADARVRSESALALLELDRAVLAWEDLVPAYHRLAADRSSEVALASVAAAVSGREVEFLAQAVSSDAPGQDHQAVLALLADAVLAGGSPQVRRMAIELACRPDCPPETASTILLRVAAALRLNDRRPAKLTLDAEPRGFGERSPQAALAALADRIDPQLRWPGRQGVVDESVPLTDVIDEGRRLFTHCVVCHGAGGLGQAGVYPPLKGSPFVNGDPARFAAILLHGLQGELEVAGKRYNGVMPKPPLLSDEDVAAVMTYVRQAFGNQAEPVGPGLVRTVREATKHRTTLLDAKELGDPDSPWTSP